MNAAAWFFQSTATPPSANHLYRIGRASAPQNVAGPHHRVTEQLQVHNAVRVLIVVLQLPPRDEAKSQHVVVGWVDVRRVQNALQRAGETAVVDSVCARMLKADPVVHNLIVVVWLAVLLYF